MARKLRRALKERILTALLFATVGAAQSGDGRHWRVHYKIRSAGRDITILAQNSAEARRVVQDMFPDAVVTGAARARAR